MCSAPTNSETLARDDVEGLLVVVVDVQRRHAAAAADGLDDREGAVAGPGVHVHVREVVGEPKGLDARLLDGARWWCSLYLE